MDASGRWPRCDGGSATYVPIAQEALLKETATPTLGSLVMGPDCGTAIAATATAFALPTRPNRARSGWSVPQGRAFNRSPHCSTKPASASATPRRTGSCTICRSRSGGAVRRCKGWRPWTPIPAPRSLNRCFQASGSRGGNRRAGDCGGLQDTDRSGVPGRGGDHARSSLAEPDAGQYSAGNHLPMHHGPLLVANTARGVLRGLFSGAVSAAKLSVWPLSPWERSASDQSASRSIRSSTTGRMNTPADAAHPMIDQRLRLQRLEAAGRDPRVGVILLDVVLGQRSPSRSGV